MANNLCRITFMQNNFRDVIWAPFGKTLLEIAKAKNIPMQGVCDGTLACSTCHIILTEDYYKKLPEPCLDELGMLDLAHGLTDTSRLACQIKTSSLINNIEIKLPQ